MKSAILIMTLILGASLWAEPLKVVPGEFIVRLRNGANAKQAFTSSMAKNLFDKTKRIQGTNDRFVRVKVKANATIDGLKAFEQSAAIQYIEPNYILSLPQYKVHATTNNTGIPADEMYTKLWGLNNSKTGFDVDAPEAWNITKGSKKIVVAVIDTGIDYNHPDLKENMWINTAEKNGTPGVDDDGNGFVDDIYGYDFANQDNNPMDDQGHGTHCAGTIGAVHNSIGVAGVASRVRLMAIKFLGQNGGTTAGAIESIYYAANNGAHIMSNSWGGGGKSRGLEDAIKYANEKGILFTAAAGNENNNNDLKPSYPANYNVDNVISVGAFAEDGERAYVMRRDPQTGIMKKIVFSNYGVKSVHVAAPGSEIVSTIPGGGYAAYSGTSMATPHVSGVLALMLSLNAKEWANNKGDARSVDLNTKSVRDFLIATSVKSESLSRISISQGRVSAANLLKKVIETYSK